MLAHMDVHVSAILVVVHMLAVWRAFLVVVHILAVRGPLLQRLLVPLSAAQTCPASLEQSPSLVV